MTLPQKHDLALYRGDTERFSVLIYDDDGTTPTDLTGVTLKAEMRSKAGGTLLAEFDVSSSAAGVVDVLITSGLSTSLPASGVWDLQLTYASGDVWTAVAGKVKITMDVTDSTVMPGLLQVVS